MPRKIKNKEIVPPMKFNEGQRKYEPDFPLIRKGEKDIKQFNRIVFWFIVILLGTFGIVLFLGLLFGG